MSIGMCIKIQILPTSIERNIWRTSRRKCISYRVRLCGEVQLLSLKYAVPPVHFHLSSGGKLLNCTFDGKQKKNNHGFEVRLYNNLSIDSFASRKIVSLVLSSSKKMLY